MQHSNPANDNQPRPQWFDDLLLAHEPFIRARIRSMEADSGKYDDIYQEVITRALERWSVYRRDGNLAGWLHWIIFHVVHKRDRSIAHGMAHQNVEPSQEYAADLSIVIERCSAEVLLSAIGHSQDDIGKRFGITGPAAHYRIKRARDLLRREAA